MSRPSSGILKNAKSVKLTYFPARGRAEKIRLVLHAGGINYTEVALGFSEWPTLKPNTPHGTMPILEVDGKMMGQSKAIMRFAAVEVGLTGTDSWDDAILDGIVDAVGDMEDVTVELIFAKGDAREAVAKKIFEENLPKFLQRMEDILKNTKSGWFSKKGMTWADIAVFNYLDSLESISGRTDICKSFPLVSKLVKDVAGAKGIKEHLAKRPADPAAAKK